MSKLLVVVDMQNDFIDGALGGKEAIMIVNNVCEKIKEAIDNNDHIIFTMDTHFAQTYKDSEEGKNLPVEHCIKDTVGWNFNSKIQNLINKLKKMDYKNGTIVTKNTFGSEELGAYIQRWKFFGDNNGKSFDTIEFVGLCTDICVIANAIVAKTAEPNAHIVVDAACCAGVTPKSHDTALDAMEALQVEILNRNKEPWR